MTFTKYRDHGDYHWRQYATTVRYRTHADYIAAWVTERPVLDIGAGDGCITALCDAVGIDDNPDGVVLAHAHGVPVLRADAAALPFGSDTFAAALMIDVLEHFDDPRPAVREAQRVAPVLYVATPPARPDGRLHDRFHVREWTPDGLEAFLSADGWMLTAPIVVGHKVMYGRFEH